jgi:hypothetical protein
VCVVSSTMDLCNIFKSNMKIGDIEGLSKKGGCVVFVAETTRFVTLNQNSKKPSQQRCNLELSITPMKF